MKRLSRSFASLAGAALVLAAVSAVSTTGPDLVAWPSDAHARRMAAPKTAGASTAVTTDILDAVAAEIGRSMAQMRIPGAPPPYFIGHKVTEVEVNEVVASLGATTWKKSRHFVSLDARVRVGSYDLDNSNFVIANNERIDGMATTQLSIEATPAIAQRSAWLATDVAYKEALEQLRAKLATRSATGNVGTGVPSHIKQPPLVREEPVLVPALEGAEHLEKRAQTISAVLRDQPHIRDSRVSFTSFLERRWYLDSEGTSAHDTRRVSGVIVVVAGQADDGQELALYFSRYGMTEKDLPRDAELVAEAKRLSRTLAALRTAPVMDNYTGPVLFEGVGAAGVVRNTLAPHLGGTPLPQGLSAQEAKQFGGELTERIGLRVMSPRLSVTDDPTAFRAQSRAIIGGYQIDDEGVAAQRVEVIENGRLQTLLTSRTPSKGLLASNGHARRTAPGGVFHGSATNLFVTGRGGLPRKALVRKLIAEAKSQGLPYALIVRQFDDAAVTAAPELSSIQLYQFVSQADPHEPPIALLAYKVYPSGKEELVRGVQLKPVPIRAWRDVIAVGRQPTVFNFLASGSHNLVHKVNGVGDGSVPSAGIESAVVTPDLLFKELDVVGSRAGQRPLPAIPPPTTPK